MVAKGDEPGRGLAFAWGRVVKRDGFESGLQHQEAATWAGQL